MKKLFTFAVAALVMLATSCAKDDVSPAQGGEQLVSFSVSTPELATRAISDGKTATDLTVTVYEKDANGSYVQLEQLTKTATFNNLQAEVDFRLVTGKTYCFAFWAQAPDATAYTFDEASATVNIDYANCVANDEAHDAFFASRHDLYVDGAISEAITLNRPFAQLNVGTTQEDWTNALKSEIEVAKTNIVVVENVYTSLNLLDGEVSNPITAELVLAENAIPNESLTVSGVDYKWLSMNYLLVNEKELTQVRMLTDDTDVEEKSWANVPLQRNYRTNILGNILTSQVDFNIVIDPIFETPDYVMTYPANVANAADVVAALEAAIANGDSEVVLDACGENIGALNGTLTMSLIPAGTTVTIRNATVSGISRNNGASGTLIFENCIFTNNSAYSINFISGNGHVVFNDCELYGWCSFGSVTVEMNDCVIRGNGKYALVRSYNNFTMNGCDIDCSNTNTSDDFHDGVSIGGGAVLTMIDCAMTNATYEYGEAADHSTIDYSSYIIVDGKRLACNQASLEAALKNGDATILENDVVVNGYLRVADAKNKSINIDGNGHTLTTGLVYGPGVAGITLSNMTLAGSNPDYYTLYANSGKVEMTNVTVSSNYNQAVCLGGGGDVVLNDCNISGTPNSSKYSAATIWCGDGRNLTINGGTYSSIFMNAQYHQDWIDNGWVSADNHATTHAASMITVNDGVIEKLILETVLGAPGYYVSADLVQNGGTIVDLVENPGGFDLFGRTKFVK